MLSVASCQVGVVGLGTVQGVALNCCEILIGVFMLCIYQLLIFSMCIVTLLCYVCMNMPAHLLPIYVLRFAMFVSYCAH